MPSELSDNERLVLARENAADKYEREYLWPSERDSFRAGWDAAMEYVNSKLAEGVGHLDEK